jgi:hypothetical protein
MTPVSWESDVVEAATCPRAMKKTLCPPQEDMAGGRFLGSQIKNYRPHPNSKGKIRSPDPEQKH